MPHAASRCGAQRPTDLESKLLQPDRQTRKRLVPGAGFRNKGEARSRATIVSGGDLDAGDACRLIRCVFGGGSGEPTLHNLGGTGAAKSQLAAPRQSRSRDHGGRGGGRQLAVGRLAAALREGPVPHSNSENSLVPNLAGRNLTWRKNRSAGYSRSTLTRDISIPSEGVSNEWPQMIGPLSSSSQSQWGAAPRILPTCLEPSVTVATAPQ